MEFTPHRDCFSLSLSVGWSVCGGLCNKVYREGAQGEQNDLLSLGSLH